jgi:PKD repeat protein
MICRVRAITVLLTSLVIITAMLMAAGLAVGAVSPLAPNPVLTPKASDVISPHVRTILSHRNAETASIWVFFTDKGVADQTGYNAKAARVQLTERAMHRRAKMGLDHVVFADLPVETSYLTQIEALGGQLRRTSRWLNAASFDLPMNRLDAVAALPFIAEVRPIAKFLGGTKPEQTTEKLDLPPTILQADALNYGSSYTQLNQLKVPAAHALGYNGQGVTLAVFDTGFRKSHEAFANAYSEGRVLAEHDFVFNDGNTANEAGDVSSAWSHGTSTWSEAGGLKDGTLYGGAYKANFILCKTEDVRSETHTEEDNWVAAIEWADSIGVDVITSSLGYGGFDDTTYSYTYADMNGATAIITQAANLADGMGIVVCNSMGNEGPAAGTISAPADAFNILAVGAVSSGGTIASFSSRGPTYDGRTKPEICAMGVSTLAASSSGDAVYNSGFSGTSAACPIAAGAVCLMVQAHPDFTPAMIRQAVTQTASRAATPDNTYGWGIVNIESALGWPITMAADVSLGNAPLAVNFTGSCALTATSWLWDFGDNTTSALQNPSHTYSAAGLYPVSLTVGTSYGPITKHLSSSIAALGDTLVFGRDSAFAGRQVVNSVVLTNSQPLDRIMIPFIIASSPLTLTWDSVSRGSRTAYFEAMNFVNYDAANKRFVVELKANNGSGSPALPAGSGEVLKIYCTTNQFAFGGLGNTLDTTDIFSNKLNLYSPTLTYKPVVVPGSFATKAIVRGDADYTQILDISDLQFLIDRLFFSGPAPVTIQSGDWTHDYLIDISDLNMVIDFLFLAGPPPTNP